MSVTAGPAELARLRTAVDADQPGFAALRDYLRQASSWLRWDGQGRAT